VEFADGWNVSGVACRKGLVVGECTKPWVQGYVNGMIGNLTWTACAALAAWPPPHTDYLIWMSWNFCPTMR